MKTGLISLIALIAAAHSAWAGNLIPKAGSCTSQGKGPGLCSCQLIPSDDESDEGGGLNSDTWPCSGLKCSDFQDSAACGGFKTVTCQLSNPYVLNICNQSVLLDDISSGDACDQVARALNTVEPIDTAPARGYCGGTLVRGNWNLISISPVIQ